MNWRAIRAVARKDLTVVLRSPMILLPMIVLPVILQVVMPLILGIAANVAAVEFASDPDLDVFLENLPPSIIDQFAGMPENTMIMLLLLVYLFAPLYLIIPMMVSSVIAADSFVGERERKTLEALLHSPMTNQELLIAKMLAAWLAAMAVSLGSFLIYAVVVNAVAWPGVGRLVFPNAMWLALVFWVAPAAAGFGLMGTVLLSSRVKTFQEAYQMGGLVVLPLLALIFGQIAGVIFLSVPFALGLGALIWLLNAALYWIGAGTFRREEILARL